MATYHFLLLRIECSALLQMGLDTVFYEAAKVGQQEMLQQNKPVALNDNHTKAKSANKKDCVTM